MDRLIEIVSNLTPMQEMLIFFVAVILLLKLLRFMHRKENERYERELIASGDEVGLRTLYHVRATLRHPGTATRPPGRSPGTAQHRPRST